MSEIGAWFFNGETASFVVGGLMLMQRVEVDLIGEVPFSMFFLLLPVLPLR